jgi:anaerobic ribonucleoside-triphosphate reductase activating protein
MKLQVANFIDDSIVDGPGLRFVIFVQGCLFHCDGCHNPKTWSLDGGESYEVDNIIELIKNNPLIKRVTISGGEPFLQTDALLELVTKLKKDNYEIMIFTGYLLEDLLKKEDDNILRILKLTDLLKEGKFVKEYKSLNLKFRGSSNQKIINLGKTRETGVLDYFQD